MPTDYTDNRLSRLWDTISIAIGKGLESGRKELIRSSRIGCYRLGISAINSKIKTHFKELGREYYSLRQAKAVSIPQLEDIVRQIKELEENIREKEARIESVVRERETEINLETPMAKGDVAEKPEKVEEIKKNKKTAEILAVNPARVAEE